MPIYTYHFGYKGEHSYSALFTGTLRDFGVVHCDDLIYLFESPLLFPNGLNREDSIMSRNLVKHYVNFASRKKPWSRTRVSTDRIGPYLNIVDNSSESYKYYNNWELVRFWDQTREFETC